VQRLNNMGQYILRRPVGEYEDCRMLLNILELDKMYLVIVSIFKLVLRSKIIRILNAYVIPKRK
jgi:hypothetical protein